MTRSASHNTQSNRGFSDIVFYQCASVLSILLCSVPAPAHFNDDDTVDFMVHLNYGRWPDYQYSLVQFRFVELATFLFQSQLFCAPLN